MASSSWFGIGHCRRQLGIAAKVDLDRRTYGARNQVAHAGQQGRDIDRLRLQRLAAGKAKQPLEQSLGPFGSLKRIREQARGALVGQPHICAGACRARR